MRTRRSDSDGTAPSQGPVCRSCTKPTTFCVVGLVVCDAALALDRRGGRARLTGSLRGGAIDRPLSGRPWRGSDATVMIPGGRRERDQPIGAADPRPAACRAHHLRREGPGDQLSADPRHPTTRGCPERPRHPARRRWLRRQQRIRRPDQHANGGASRRERPQVQPVPHDGPLFTHPGGAPQRPQPPRRRDGRHHRDRDVGAGLQLAPSQHLRPAGGDAQAQRLLHGPVRQMPRGPGLADAARWARSTTGRRAAAASSTSTGSSAARRTSTRRRSTTTRRPSSPSRRPRRATTSPRT